MDFPYNHLESQMFREARINVLSSERAELGYRVTAMLLSSLSSS